MKFMKKFMKRHGLFGGRVVRLEAAEELTDIEIERALANQGDSSVVRAIAQVIDEECMAELNASLDQLQSERVCASAAGGASALMALKARLVGYLRPVGEEGNRDEDV